jgi:hypothetical protein
MPQKPSWIDYLNLAVTLVVAVIGIIVAVRIGSSSDRLNQESLSIASATFLVDDQPRRRLVGSRIVTWLTSRNVALPDWESELVREIAITSDAQGPDSKPSTGAAQVVGPSGPTQPTDTPTTSDAANQAVANQLFAAIGGTTPRLFIKYADAALQKDAAEKIRNIMNQYSLSGQRLVVPKLEHGAVVPGRIELRFFRPNDQEEAKQLANKLTTIIGAPVVINDRSDTYKDRPNVKARTYELWFPVNQKLDVDTGPGF